MTVWGRLGLREFEQVAEEMTAGSSSATRKASFAFGERRRAVDETAESRWAADAWLLCAAVLAASFGLISISNNDVNSRCVRRRATNVPSLQPRLAATGWFGISWGATTTMEGQ